MKMVSRYGFGSSLLARTPTNFAGPDDYTGKEAGRLLAEAHAAATAILDAYALEIELIASRLGAAGRLSAADLSAIVPFHKEALACLLPVAPQGAVGYHCSLDA